MVRETRLLLPPNMNFSLFNPTQTLSRPFISPPNSSAGSSSSSSGGGGGGFSHNACVPPVLGLCKTSLLCGTARRKLRPFQCSSSKEDSFFSDIVEQDIKSILVTSASLYELTDRFELLDVEGKKSFFQGLKNVLESSLIFMKRAELSNDEDAKRLRDKLKQLMDSANLGDTFEDIDSFIQAMERAAGL